MILRDDELFEREISEKATSQLEKGHEEIMPTLGLSIRMPCLDEAETLETCIRNPQRYLSISGISGEVLVDDNGTMRHDEF
jgi:hypothetical protein